ncbi:MAG: phage shock protein A [Myxococcota bacterium]|jgi:phage shock protein A
MGRLWRIIKGWFLGLVGKAEEANPRAMLEAEIADFHKATAQFNENLAKQAGMIERLKAQISTEEKKLEMAKARAAAAYAAKNMQRAGSLALTVKETQRDITENQAQQTAAETLYQNLVRQRDTYVKEARQRIDDVKGKISKAEMAEAQAQLTELASDVVFNPDGSGLSALDKKLDERIAHASGKVRVASEQMDASEWSMTEAEQSAMEAAALAEFAKEMGLDAPAAAPAAAAPAAESAGMDLGPAEPVES